MGARPCDWQEASSGMWGSLPGWVSRLLGGRTLFIGLLPLPVGQPGFLPFWFVWGTQQPADL